MGWKKRSVAVAALLMLAAVAAGSASAEVKTERAEWYIGPTPGTTLAVGTDTNISKKIEVLEHTPEIGAKAEFTTTIAGLPVQLTSTEAECIGCVITNKEVTEKAGAIAFGTGKLLFKKVVSDKNLPCTVSDELGNAGQVETKPLNIHADWMDVTTTNKKAFIQFLPASGTIFAQFQLAGTGCEAIAGKYNVTGSVFAESVKNTGEFSTTQAIKVGKAVQETAGASLKVGANVATLTGTAGFTLENGKEFAVKP
jgi:hypothetical protein